MTGLSEGTSFNLLQLGMGPWDVAPLVDACILKEVGKISLARKESCKDLQSDFHSLAFRNRRVVQVQELN